MAKMLIKGAQAAVPKLLVLESNFGNATLSSFSKHCDKWN